MQPNCARQQLTTLGMSNIAPRDENFMRLSTLILLFVTPAFAQATQPMTFQQTQSGQWQGKKVTSKETLAYVVEFESTHSRFDHDYYFKPQGIMPSAIEDFALLSPPSRKPRPIAMTGGR